MRLALVAVLAILAAGCGSGPSAEPRTGAPPPPGTAQTRTGPPHAWLETSDGNRWLAGGSTCWQFKGGNICADAAEPTCDAPPIPHFRLDRGARVRAHLGFTPDEASVDGTAAQLHGRILEWKVSKSGVFTVFARARPGDASYSGCVDLTS